jgi:asparaginyl-tRNA synthetase
MEKAFRIADLFKKDREVIGQEVKVQGWVRTRRDSKAGLSFIELNDGSCMRNLQVIVEHGHPELEASLERVTTGSSLSVMGTVSESPGKGQSVELKASHLLVHGWADPANYPLQKKRHSLEFLRQISHLRPRTNTIGAVTRVRSRLSFAIHDFFHKRGFYYINTPIITASDCEGAGEVFRVTAPGFEGASGTGGGQGVQEEFFGRPTFLTVSGQLQAEIYALALGKVYTFGPTFRAENSNTSRHLAEFWMVEPEMAFCDLQGNLALAEEFLKEMVTTVLNECTDDMEFFNKFIEPTILGTLANVVKDPFEVLEYTEAVKLLKASGETFTFPVEWGNDLQAEHERYLTEKVFKKPVAIIDYPRAIKPFYMKVNDEGNTVAAMDVLVPGTGEIIGGAQREDRLDVLIEQMKLKNISQEDYKWYLELREFGSVPHAGFGLGLERLVQFVTGLPNIREVIPFPRTPGHAEF